MEKLIDQFSSKTVLVVGDVMLDKYIWGTVTRISPEAPVQIVDVQREAYAPGGAANVATNIAALGGRVNLIGVSRKDDHRDMLIDALNKYAIESVFVNDDRPTTTKVRIMVQRQQLIRCDYERAHPLPPTVEDSVIAFVQKLPADAIAISDYAKGTITQRIYDTAKRVATHRGIPLIVDPKPKNKIEYRGATIIKLNHQEACALAGVLYQNGDIIQAIGPRLVERLQSEIVVTRAEQGVSVFHKDGTAATVPTKARQVSDVTGAGDTFLATLTLAYASKASLEDAVAIANIAAGIKVSKVGAVPVTCEELRQELK